MQGSVLPFVGVRRQNETHNVAVAVKKSNRIMVNKLTLALMRSILLGFLPTEKLRLPVVSRLVGSRSEQTNKKFQCKLDSKHLKHFHETPTHTCTVGREMSPVQHQIYDVPLSKHWHNPLRLLIG